MCIRDSSMSPKVVGTDTGKEPVAVEVASPEPLPSVPSSSDVQAASAIPVARAVAAAPMRSSERLMEVKVP